MIPETIRPSIASDNGIPDFLIKTTLGCSLIVVVILIPFTINNLLQERYILTLATSLIGITCLINVWYGVKGRYSLLVNAYLVAPIATISIVYTMTQLGHAGSYWPFLLVLAYYFVLPEKRAWIFNLVTVSIIVPAAWSLLEQPSAARFSAVIIGVSLFAFISMREVNILHALLKERAATDELTGLLNRNLLESSLGHAIAQSQRSGVPMSLIMLDADHFKSINDNFGHGAGDDVLKLLGSLFNSQIRSSDTAFRIGGEEFLILVYKADEKQAATIAENLRRQVENSSILPDQTVTISAGVAELQKNMSVSAWMNACDEKLYRAKQGGRNIVVV